jgi:aspartyl-tRNA(Asn)/glutamyl-tRNA(Gln) amidotransferase subunit B
MEYKPIIGLEVHIELKTKSKMFCSCSADHFGKPPNSQTCPICLGMPGALPYPNRKAIEWVMMLGLALNCRLPLFSKFDRKNYFYPDLPKGFQISQYDQPLARDGELKIKSGSLPGKQKLKTVRIRRVHLEEDTGKLIHQAGLTLIDFNRAGVPLVEIVTEPDIESSLEAKEFLEKLQQLVRSLGIANADMEKGQMRCEPTVNLEIETEQEIEKVFTPLVEIKNINSFKFAQKAIDYEIQRQLEEFEKTGQEKQSGNKTTRGWDEVKQKTFLQRAKEEAADYRYFPEPDIPPLVWTKKQIEDLKIKVLKLELPDQKKERFIRDYNLSEYNAEVLVADRWKSAYFEEAVKVSDGLEVGTVANWIINKKVDINKTDPKQLVELIRAKKEGVSADTKEILTIVKKIIEDNQKIVAQYHQGKTGVLEFLIGQAMKAGKGQFNPELVRKIILENL